MDDDGFAVQGRRRGGTNRGNVRDRDHASFVRDVPRYTGSSKDFDSSHARRYGREEGLGPDGRHDHGSMQFPRGSERQKLHTQYSASTKARDNTRSGYENELRAANKEFRSMGAEQQRHYRANTGELAPDQHERLDPRAQAYRDKCYSNATNRETFLRSHPHGYHSLEDQDKHHNYADRAYKEYEYASERQKHHERHRSYSNVDKEKDRWGRPVGRR